MFKESIPLAVISLYNTSDFGKVLSCNVGFRRSEEQCRYGLHGVTLPAIAHLVGARCSLPGLRGLLHCARDAEELVSPRRCCCYASGRWVPLRPTDIRQTRIWQIGPLVAPVRPPAGLTPASCLPRAAQGCPRDAGGQRRRKADARAPTDLDCMCACVPTGGNHLLCEVISVQLVVLVAYE